MHVLKIPFIISLPILAGWEATIPIACKPHDLSFVIVHWTEVEYLSEVDQAYSVSEENGDQAIQGVSGTKL